MKSEKQQLHAAQVRYDNQMPEDDEPCSHRDEMGQSLWKRVGNAEDGTEYVRCRKCGMEVER